MYKRKTVDIYEIQGLYTYGYEVVTYEETRKEALQQLKAYRENEPGTLFKLVKHREILEVNL